MIIVTTTYGGQQATLVEEASSRVCTCLKGSGQVRGPILKTVSLLGPNRSWSYHTVTASGMQHRLVSMLIP